MGLSISGRASANIGSEIVIEYAWSLPAGYSIEEVTVEVEAGEATIVGAPSTVGGTTTVKLTSSTAGLSTVVFTCRNTLADRVEAVLVSFTG